MRLQGTFKDNQDIDCQVVIDVKDGVNTIVNIGSESSDIFFADDDPVLIESVIEDTFQVVITSSCTINLLTTHYLGDQLFSANARSARVNVRKAGKLIFAGFITPNIYTQPYNRKYDLLSIECTDALATLQYYKFQNAVDDDSYTNVK